MAQAVEGLLCKHEALSSNPSHQKKKKKKQPLVPVAFNKKHFCDRNEFSSNSFFIH
jgi:hypothetical protein